MTFEEIKKILEENLKGKIKELINPFPRRMTLWVDKADALATCQVLKEKAGFYHLSTITGRDTGDKLEALYHFAQNGMALTLRLQTERNDPKLPTTIAVYPGAVFYEREVHDLVGINFEGHPDMRPLVLPDEWPQGIYPLRKDWHHNREKGVIE
jgi:NADH:ubiquinone oxidoreductase subunit C